MERTIWIVVVLIVGIGSFVLGKNNGITNNLPQQTVLQPTPTVAVLQQVPTAVDTAPTLADIDLDGVCDKTGPSQKRDYLTPYTIKEGDTINKIAEDQLGNVSRNTEILTLNDNIQQLTLGSIMYLPPREIKQSSGHIYEVSGKIVKKDLTSWQLSYGGGEKGMGIVFPGFWFKDISTRDTYKIGDCVTILFDNGVKVYSIKKS